eukprot:scaffold13933_cov219-Amphora_coffeaeformis.AAC.2
MSIFLPFFSYSDFSFSCQWSSGVQQGKPYHIVSTVGVVGMVPRGSLAKAAGLGMVPDHSLPVVKGIEPRNGWPSLPFRIPLLASLSLG